jgi:dienelactone hydrolase
MAVSRSAAPTGGRRWLTRLALAGIVLVLVGAVAIGWLLRDPEPYFAERRGTLVESTLEPLESDGRFANERVRVRSSSGLATEILLRRPVDSAGVRRRPVFLMLGGYETGQRAATLIDDTQGNIVVAMAYPYDGNVKVKGLAVVPEVPRIRQALRDTPPAVLLVLDYLLSRPDVDRARIELVGASFGTPFATIAAALDERVTRLWSVHGAGEPYTLMSHNLQRRLPWAPARATVAGLANLLAAGPRMAPERWISRIAPRPFIMINATEDERLPRDAVMTLFDSARNPKEIIWLPGMHVQSNRTEILQGLVRTVLERAARDR